MSQTDLRINPEECKVHDLNFWYPCDRSTGTGGMAQYHMALRGFWLVLVIETDTWHVVKPPTVCDRRKSSIMACRVGSIKIRTVDRQTGGGRWQMPERLEKPGEGYFKCLPRHQRFTTQRPQTILGDSVRRPSLCLFCLTRQNNKLTIYTMETLTGGYCEHLGQPHENVERCHPEHGEVWVWGRVCQRVSHFVSQVVGQVVHAVVGCQAMTLKLKQGSEKRHKKNKEHANLERKKIREMEREGEGKEKEGWGGGTRREKERDCVWWLSSERPLPKNNKKPVVCEAPQVSHDTTNSLALWATVQHQNCFQTSPCSRFVLASTTSVHFQKK